MTQSILQERPTAKAPVVYPAAQGMSYQQFLDWMDEETHAEWENGEVVAMSPVSNEHSDLSGFLLTLLRIFARRHNLGVVRYEPFQMKTGPQLPGRSPDVLFVAKENLPRLKKTYLDGPADLVIEVVSPESQQRDYVKKRREYQKGGVREYWIMDYERREARFYQLGPSGRYRRISPDANGCYHSAVLPGLWVRVEWLWQKPLPDETDVLKEWGLI